MDVVDNIRILYVTLKLYEEHFRHSNKAIFSGSKKEKEHHVHPGRDA